MIGLSAILAAIGSALAGLATTTASALTKVFDFLRSIIGWFLNVAPKPIRVFVFLFMLLFIANVLFGALLSTAFVCTSDNQVRKVNFFTGLKFFITGLFSDVQDSTIISESESYTPTSHIVRVACVNQAPKPFFYNINLLSYSLWILLLVLIEIMPLVIKWYKTTGIVH